MADKHTYRDFEQASCDVCGKEGLMSADYDILEVSQDEPHDRSLENGRCFRFGAKKHFGCLQHPAVITVYNLDGTMCVNVPSGFSRVREDSLLFAFTADASRQDVLGNRHLA